MTDAEIWAEIFKQAGVKKAVYTVPAPASGVKGRFIAHLATVLVNFWNKHQATLIPVLSQLAVAALEAVAQNLTAIAAVNNPGPE